MRLYCCCIFGSTSSHGSVLLLLKVSGWDSTEREPLSLEARFGGFGNLALKTGIGCIRKRMTVIT